MSPVVVEAEVDISRPPEQVFDYCSDRANIIANDLGTDRASGARVAPNDLSLPERSNPCLTV